MFILGHLLIGLAQLFGMICSLVYFLLVVRIILSWVNADPYNEIIRTIYMITDYILVPIRRVVPLQVGMFDFSPIVAFMLLYFLKYFVVSVLVTMGHKLLN